MSVVRVGLFAVCFVVGCAHVDRAALGTAAALTVCDAVGTYKAAASSWGADMQEGNLLLGKQPAPGAVTLYFAAVLTAELVSYSLMPAKYRSFTFGIVTGVEAKTVYLNVDSVGVCGL